MNLKEVTHYGQIKGLNLIGTGDFTHPKWLRELKENLIEDPGTNLYKTKEKPEFPVRHMITGEVSTIFTYKEEVKKIHHLILTPNLETATQINNRLTQYGDLTKDGRPTLDMTAPQLVEEIMETSNENLIIPAHAWTPWFSLFGAFSGFNQIEDCYQDMTRHIHAIETGLSSDPPMNWRLSSLDRFTLVSNSDSHSHWPWRIGREANVFELERLTYHEVTDAIRRKDPQKFKFTIETDPAYGKYHWTGHRNCKISLSPQEAIKLGNRCPKCHRTLTKGVEQRVEELADRPPNFKPEGVPGYIHLLPLSEIISTILGVSYPGIRKVWEIYNTLTTKFGDEYTVLINAPREEMSKLVNSKIADAITRVREEKVKVIPGYDGVYGQLTIFEREREEKPIKIERSGQRAMTDFI